MHIRLGYNLQQGHARAIEVDQGIGRFIGRWCRHMITLGGVLLQMRPPYPDPDPFPSFTLHIHPTRGGQRMLILRDLIALGEIWVEVVLAREDRQWVDLAVQRQPYHHPHLHSPPVHHRHRARQAGTHRTDRCIGLSHRGVHHRTAAEHLRRGLQLRMDLHANHSFVLSPHLTPAPNSMSVAPCARWSSPDTQPQRAKRSPPPEGDR